MHAVNRSRLLKMTFHVIHRQKNSTCGQIFRGWVGAGVGGGVGGGGVGWGPGWGVGNQVECCQRLLKWEFPQQLAQADDGNHSL